MANYSSSFIGPIKPTDTRGYVGPQGPSSPGYVQGTANTVPLNTQSSLSGPSVLSASTVGGGSGGVAAPSTSYLDQISQNTKNAYNDQLNSANTLYDERAADLNTQLAGLGSEKDNLLDQIGTTYGGLIQSANDTLAKNVGLLNGQKGDVTQQYDVARTNSARQLADAIRQNRQLGRAQGTLGSSYYTDLQTGAGRTAEQRVGGLNTEEHSKLDAIGTAIVNANTDTNTKVQSLKEEQANAEQEQISKYQTLADQVRNDLRFNDRQKLDALSGINDQLASALDNIGQTMLQYQQYAGGLGQTAASQQATIQSYDPFSAIQPTLDTNTAFSAAYSPLQTSSTTQAPTSDLLSSIIGTYNPTKQRSYLDTLTA